MDTKLVARIGTGPYLFEALAPLFEDPELGVAALRFVPRLRGADPARLEAALAVATRSDRDFFDAAAATWLALVPEEGRAGRLLALRAHAAPVLQRLGFVAAVAAGEGADGALAESALASKDPWLEALGVAQPSASLAGRARLLESLLAGRLPDAAEAAAAGLLADGPADDVVRLVDRAGTDAAFRAMLLAAPLSARRRRDLVAEAFARRPAVVDVAAPLVGLPPGSPLAVCAASAFADAGMDAALADAARREGLGDEERRALRAKLPLSGVVLGHAGDILALAEAARVVHAPFLVASQDFVPWPERGRIAAALVRVGHPEGRALLVRTLSATAPEAVGGALDGFALAKIRPSFEELVPLLAQGDGELRSLGAQAFA